MYRGHYIIRWLFFMLGLIVIGLGVALTIKGKQFGLGGWDVLHYGMWKQFGLTIGLWAIIVGIVVLLITVAITREWPKVGVFVNMFTLGVVIDFFNFLIPTPEGFTLQLIYYIIGAVLLSFGVALYITPELGAGPRDTFMLLLVEYTPLDLKTARTLIELVVLIIGYFLGGPVAVGTIVITFMLGPFIQMWLPLTRRWLGIWCTPIDTIPSSK